MKNWNFLVAMGVLGRRQNKKMLEKKEYYLSSRIPRYVPGNLSVGVSAMTKICSVQQRRWRTSILLPFLCLPWPNPLSWHWLELFGRSW